MKRITMLSILTLVLLVAACGDDEPAGTLPTRDVPAVSDPLPTDGGGDVVGTVPGPIGATMSVEKLLAAGDSSDPRSVIGYLFVYPDGSMVLSDFIAESYPPQPGGPSVPVEGVSLQTVPLQEPSGDSELALVQWTDAPIELIGILDGGVFSGSTPASS